jgi:hypothetical protein
VPFEETILVSYGINYKQPDMNPMVYLFFIIGPPSQGKPEKVIWTRINRNDVVHETIMTSPRLVEYCQRMNMRYIPTYPRHPNHGTVERPTSTPKLTPKPKPTPTPKPTPKPKVPGPKTIDVRAFMRAIRQWRGTRMHVWLNVSNLKIPMNRLLAMIPGATFTVVRKAATLYPDKVRIVGDAGEGDDPIVLIMLCNVF